MTANYFLICICFISCFASFGEELEQIIHLSSIGRNFESLTIPNSMVDGKVKIDNSDTIRLPQLEHTRKVKILDDMNSNYESRQR